MRKTKHHKPVRVVITGGPCSGKTELWRFLGEKCPHFMMVPETATDLILAGQTRDRLGVEAFQLKIFETQRTREEEALLKGVFLLCDRGLADGLAYFPGLLSFLDVSLEGILRYYDLVLHLSVIQDPVDYAAHARTNPARQESHKQAVDLEKTIQAIYGSHPSYYFIQGDLEKKKREALRIVQGKTGDSNRDR